MARRNQQQYILRYRGHKTIKGMENGDWISMVLWDKKAAEISKHELKLYWNHVEVVPFVDPVRKRQYQNASSDRRRDRDDE